MLAVLAMLFSVCTVAGCEVQDMGSLSDLSKPYTGVYACEKMTLGGEDVLGDFSYVRLELERGGDFTLSWRQDGSESTWEGGYEVDLGVGTITLTAKEGGRTASRTYRMEEGAILIDENFLGRPFFAEFKQ